MVKHKEIIVKRQIKTLEKPYLLFNTRKSCMNARGIPTAAYQVLHLLSYTRWGTPPRPGPTGGYPRWGTPPPSGYPQPGLTGRYLRWGTLPSQVRPGGTQGGVPPSTEGVPPSAEVGYSPSRGTPLPPGWLDLAGVPPPRPPQV